VERTHTQKKHTQHKKMTEETVRMLMKLNIAFFPKKRNAFYVE